MKRPASVAPDANAGGASKRDGLLYFSTAERNEAMGIDWMKGGADQPGYPTSLHPRYIWQEIINPPQEDHRCQLT